MTEINQTIDINELSAMRVDDLPLLTFKDKQNKLKQKMPKHMLFINILKREALCRQLPLRFWRLEGGQN